MKKKVSLYIPCYNANEYVEKCIKSVINQTYPVDEIIIIDDGSVDTTAKIASKYDVNIIKLEENKGLGYVRNLAFEIAKNDFVASLDADCVAKPDWLDKLMYNFKLKDIVGVGGNLIENQRTLVNKWRTEHMKQNWGSNKIINPPFLFGSNCVFRKSAIISIGKYNCKYKTNYEDVDISKRLMENGYKLVYEPKAIVVHQKRDSLFSLLKSNWKWHLFSYPLPNRIIRLVYKTGINLYKSYYYLKKDFRKYPQFILIDFLIFPTHSLFDFCFYVKSLFNRNKVF